MTEQLPLCECGCGKRVSKVGNRFIHNHHLRGKKCSPETLILMSKTKLQYYKDNPEAGKEHSEFMIEYWSDQTNRDAMSEIRLQYFIDNPEILETMSKERLQYNKDHPEFLERNAEMWREYWSDQDHKDKMSEILIEYCKDPKVLKLMSERMENSEAEKASQDRQRGGNDIVNHHYIYDHSDLSKYTMKVTRSKHGQIHAWIRKSGIKVPHINVETKTEEENKKEI